MTTKLDLISHINQLGTLEFQSTYTHINEYMCLLLKSALIAIIGKLRRNTNRVMGFRKTPLRNLSVCF